LWLNAFLSFSGDHALGKQRIDHLGSIPQLAEQSLAVLANNVTPQPGGA